MMEGKFCSRPDFGVRSPGWLAARALRVSVLLAILAMTLAVPVRAQEAEYPVAGGQFFTQTGGDTADPADGYAVVDDSEARFWTAFEEFGGVAGVGYPVSRRFIWDGFVTQVMQKAVFQWRPDEQATAFVNVFDDLHRLGFDGQLADELVPEQEEFDETGLSWPQILEKRVALLDEEPLLRRIYLASDDYLRHFGLPTSQVREYSGLRAIRLQRAVLQLWLDDFPWARAGTVTVANGGDLAKQLGMFPPAALAPHAASAIPPTLPAGSQDPRLRDRPVVRRHRGILPQRSPATVQVGPRGRHRQRRRGSVPDRAHARSHRRFPLGRDRVRALGIRRVPEPPAPGRRSRWRRRPR